jgi:wyosine [tRNA(Phe)-imidazoG37] synthetase (radical SAM superfamily)
LGLSLTPHKICTFNCVYCQLGRTRETARERKEYVSVRDILDELKLWLGQHSEESKALRFITLCGAGEPTLNLRIDALIAGIKEITATPIAVITNASLLPDAAVRAALMRADLIIPSLNAVTAKAFQKINRPRPDIKIEEIIEGLVALKKEFPGKIWLEVMLVAGVNDDLRQIKKMKEAIERINPDKVQLNSPVRTTAEPDAFSVDKKKLEKIKEILGGKAEII